MSAKKLAVYSLYLKSSRQSTAEMLFNQAGSNDIVGKQLLSKRDLSNNLKPKPYPIQGKFPMGNHLTQASVATTISVVYEYTLHPNIYRIFLKGKKGPLP